MIDYKGKLGVAVAFPVIAQLLASLDIPGMTAQVAALGQLIANFKPPTVAAGITFAANLTAQINATLNYPVLAISAEIALKLALLKARLELVLKIVNLITQGSLRVYEQQGTAGTFGAEWTLTLAGTEATGGIPPAQSTYAVILVADAGTAGETTLKFLRAGA